MNGFFKSCILTSEGRYCILFSYGTQAIQIRKKKKTKTVEEASSPGVKDAGPHCITRGCTCIELALLNQIGGAGGK